MIFNMQLLQECPMGENKCLKKDVLRRKVFLFCALRSTLQFTFFFLNILGKSLIFALDDIQVKQIFGVANDKSGDEPEKGGDLSIFFSDNGDGGDLSITFFAVSTFYSNTMMTLLRMMMSAVTLMTMTMTTMNDQIFDKDEDKDLCDTECCDPNAL